MRGDPNALIGLAAIDLEEHARQLHNNDSRFLLVRTKVKTHWRLGAT